jgi:hypothetical protein
MYLRAGGWATLRHSHQSGGRHGEGSDAQQQRKEEAEAGQEREERRRSVLAVRRHAQPGQTRHLVHEPIRQEALAGDHRARHQRELAPGVHDFIRGSRASLGASSQRNR